MLNNQPKWGTWNDAKKAFDEGKIQDALSMILNNPTQDVSYFYNVGILYFRLKEYGKAVAYLEKAFWMDPIDLEIKNSLQISKKTHQAQLSSWVEDPAANWYESLHVNLPLDLLAGCLSIVALAMFFGRIKFYIQTKKVLQTFLSPIGLCFLLTLTASSLSMFLGKQSKKNILGISLEKVSIRSGPGEHFLELSSLDAGSKVRSDASKIQEKRDQTTNTLWYLIRFQPKSFGWIKASSILLL